MPAVSRVLHHQTVIDILYLSFTCIHMQIFQNCLCLCLLHFCFMVLYGYCQSWVNFHSTLSFGGHSTGVLGLLPGATATQMAEVFNHHGRFSNIARTADAVQCQSLLLSGHYGCLKCIYIHKKVDYCECQQFVQTRVFAAFEHWNLALTLSLARSEIFVKTFTDQSVEVQKITICVKAAQHIKPYLGKAYLKISNY